MSLHTARMVRGLRERVAQTALDDPDPRLQGRTYAIPFDRVWEAARGLANSWRGWRVIEADDYDGIIRIEVQTLVFRRLADLVIHIGLDHDAQTRVDLQSSSRKGYGDLGSNPRRIARFINKLDRAVATTPSPRTPSPQALTE